MFEHFEWGVADRLVSVDDVALAQAFAEVFDLVFGEFAHTKVGVVAFVYLEVLGAARRNGEPLFNASLVAVCAVSMRMVCSPGQTKLSE